MRLLKAAMAVLAVTTSSAGAAAAAPPVGPPRVITNPDWLAKPSGNTVAQAYPPLATKLSIAGRVVMSCAVDSVGALKNCLPIFEAPRGLGFGQGALRLSRAFKMRPKTVNGEPVEGGNVRIPIMFQLALTEPYREPKPASPAALEAARRLTALFVADDTSRSGYEQEADNLDFVPIRGISDEVRALAAAAVRDSYPKRVADSREATSRLYASLLTEPQLKAIADFAATPAGKAIWGNDDESSAMGRLFSREANRVSALKIRETFCLRHDCREEHDLVGLMKDAAEPNPKVTIPNPVWAARASDSDIARTRPGLAQTMRLGGAVRLTCKVGALGSLKDCAVAKETPEGLGLGAAARALTPFYRLSQTMMGQGAQNETVPVMLVFPTPDLGSDDSLPEQPPARSARALALATELLAAETSSPTAMRAAMLERIEKWRRENPPAGVSEAQWQQAMEPYVAGNLAAFQRVSELRAAYMTTRLTDDQMLAATRFFRSPAGVTWVLKSAEMATGRAAIGQSTNDLIWADAGEAVCRKLGCPSASAPGGWVGPRTLTPPPEPQYPNGVKPPASTATP